MLVLPNRTNARNDSTIYMLKTLQYKPIKPVNGSVPSFPSCESDILSRVKYVDIMCVVYITLSSVLMRLLD